MRVLIVDDDSDQRHLLAESFTAIGWSIVAHARDVEQAAHIAATQVPDAVVIDPVLPDCTAEQSLELMKLCSPKAVLVMYGTPCEKRFIQTCQKSGADLYLLKSQGAFEVARRTNEMALKRRLSGEEPPVALKGNQ